MKDYGESLLARKERVPRKVLAGLAAATKPAACGLVPS